MRLPKALPILIAGIIAATEVAGSEPIVIEYGDGHAVAMDRLMEAEKQLKAGNVESAQRSVNAVIQGDPKFWPALFTRAKIYIRQQKWQLAMQDCGELLRQYPYLIEAALLRAEINAKIGKYAESLKEIDHVVSIHPRQDHLARALEARAWFRLTCPDPTFRNGQQALKDAKAACNVILWKDADMIDTLALAYAETGDFDSAMRYEEKALGTKGITPQETKVCQQHLALFKEHRTLSQSH